MQGRWLTLAIGVAKRLLMPLSGDHSPVLGEASADGAAEVFQGARGFFDERRGFFLAVEDVGAWADRLDPQAVHRIDLAVHDDLLLRALAAQGDHLAAVLACRLQPLRAAHRFAFAAACATVSRSAKPPIRANSVSGRR